MAEESCGSGEGFEDRSEIYQNNDEKEQEMAVITKYVLTVWPDLIENCVTCRNKYFTLYQSNKYLSYFNKLNV